MLKGPRDRPGLATEKKTGAPRLRPTVQIYRGRLTLRFVVAALAWLSLLVLVFLTVANAVLYDAASFYKVSLLIPQALFTGVAIGLTLTVGLAELRLADILALVAAAFNVVLFARELPRLLTCLDPTQESTPDINFYICNNEPEAQWFLPVFAGLLILVAAVAAIVLQQWIPLRMAYLRESQRFLLFNTDPIVDSRRFNQRGRSTAYGTGADTRSRDAALLDASERTAQANVRRSRGERNAKLVVGALAVLLAVVQLSTTVLDLALPDTTAFYRNVFHLLPAVFSGVCLGCLWTVGRGEVLFGIVAGFLALLATAGGGALELWRLLLCVTDLGVPRNSVEADICTSDPVLTYLNPIYFLVQLAVVIVMLVFLFRLLRAINLRS